MKKSQSISRKPKQKKHRNNTIGISIPRESKPNWFIMGLLYFIALLVFYYLYYFTTLEEHQRDKVIAGLLSGSLLCIMTSFLGYTFIKEWTIDIYAKYKNSQKFSLDDIGITLWLICVIISVFTLIFFIDWTNWKSYIIHISTVLAVSFSRVLTLLFKKIWEKVKTWFTKR